MNKIHYLIFFVVMIIPFSCEKPEIKPEQDTMIEQQTVTSYDIVGTWVLCGITYEPNAVPDIIEHDFKDTIRFSQDGKYVYVRGDYYENGSSFVDNHFYESTKRYLVLYDSNNDYDYTFRFHEIAFIENGSQLLIFEWINTPPTNQDLPTNRRYRRIN